MIKAIYSRFGLKDYREEADLENAKRGLIHDNNYNLAYPIGILDCKTNTIYIPDTEPVVVSNSDYRLQDIRKVCGLSDTHEFSEIIKFSL